MERRWVWKLMVGLLLTLMMLAGCGGGDKKDNNNTSNATSAGGDQTPGATSTIKPLPTLSGPTVTPHEPSPRSEVTPEGDPYTFEAPFSAGNFVRQTMRGNVTSDRTGGLQASYTRDQDVIALTIYHFDQPEQAIDTVRFVLEGTSVTGTVETPYYSPSVAYGVVQVRSGAYMAAWSHYGWAFIVQSSSAVDVLNEFLQSFPY